MNSIQSNIESPLRQDCTKTLHLRKILLVIAVIMAVATITFFSAGTMSGLIATGAAGWKIALASVGCLVSATSLLGSVYFAFKNNMFEDTDQNGRDATNYLLNTLGTVTYVISSGIKSAYPSHQIK
jgi:hypothetical protein